MAYSKEAMLKFTDDLKQNPAFELMMKEIFADRISRLQKEYFSMDYEDKTKEEKFKEIHFLQKIEDLVNARLNNTK